MGLFRYLNNALKGLALFMMAVMSEEGSPSSSRFLMVLFSFATVRMMFLIVRHLVTLTDATILGLWLGNLPMIVASLIGLIATPYAINKGANSLTSIAGLMTSVKAGKTTDTPDPSTQTNILIKN